MWVCQRGIAVETFRVGLGRGGFGKRAQGDDKTPLGEYALGEPRASRRFHLFVPVGYPTADQRRGGFTGGDVGVHGPTSWFRWLPGGATWFNRTRGCIELGSTIEIEQVAQWVRSGKVIRIIIR
jgi:murein L,D-transpeptidase YafK